MTEVFSWILAASPSVARVVFAGFCGFLWWRLTKVESSITTRLDNGLSSDVRKAVERSSIAATQSTETVKALDSLADRIESITTLQQEFCTSERKCFSDRIEGMMRMQHESESKTQDRYAIILEKLAGVATRQEIAAQVTNHE